MVIPWGPSELLNEGVANREIVEHQNCCDQKVGCASNGSQACCLRMLLVVFAGFFHDGLCVLDPFGSDQCRK